MNNQELLLSRRRFLQSTGLLGILTALEGLLPRYARAGMFSAPLTTSVRIERTALSLGEFSGTAITVNGSMPGPLLRFREGHTVTLEVANALRGEDTSIHWHGLLVPPEMDGVPGVSFAGIRPGETFTYRFPLRQSGTYWYHSHSGLQEQSGLLGP
jgi:FtsP/CotA-like multicopper oxidase with cupredoxin domain